MCSYSKYVSILRLKSHNVRGSRWQGVRCDIDGFVANDNENVVDRFTLLNILIQYDYVVFRHNRRNRWGVARTSRKWWSGNGLV
jgi:hypothetical protein